MPQILLRSTYPTTLADRRMAPASPSYTNELSDSSARRRRFPALCVCTGSGLARIRLGGALLPSCRHLRGGCFPSSAHRPHTFLPRLNHRCWRSSSSSALGLHLLLKMRLMASGDISNFCAITSVV